MFTSIRELVYIFSDLLFPLHIYYNAERCILVNGIIERVTRDFDQKDKNYEIYDIDPNYVKDRVHALISLNNLNKETMKMVLNGLEECYLKYRERSPESLIFIDNPDIDRKYGEYLEIVKNRKNDLINIYLQLSNKYSDNQNKKSYVWQGDPDSELIKFYSLMIDKYKLIAPETTYDQFKAVFTGQPTINIIPIKWHQDNASELLYFNEAIKSKVNVVWNIYQRMTACFVKPDGKQFKVAWKSLKTNIEINLSVEKQEAIDELLKKL